MFVDARNESGANSNDTTKQFCFLFKYYFSSTLQYCLSYKLLHTVWITRVFFLIAPAGGRQTCRMNHHIPSSQALVVVKNFAYFPTDFCIIYPDTFCEYSVPGPCMGILRAKIKKCVRGQFARYQCTTAAAFYFIGK
jgi:hypothetical protein